MTWKIDFSKKAFSFAEKQNIYDKTIEEIKRLTGDWKDFYRIRKGKIRIIFTINYESKRLYIDKIDFRGDVYK